MRFSEVDLREFITPLIGSMGYDLWGIELLSQGKNVKFRLFIEKDSGVNIEDCVLVSKHVSDALFVEGFESETYSLEVSSPGMDRILFDETHYQMHIGDLVEVRLYSLFDGQRNFVGCLKGTEEECVVLQVDQQEYLFPNEEIRRIKLVPVFD